MRLLGAQIVFLTMLAAAGGALAEDVKADEPAARICFSASETRDAILAHKLADPFALLRAQASEHHAEAIAVKLCQVGSSFVYEIDLLRRDGRLIHTRVDARTGRSAAGSDRR